MTLKVVSRENPDTVEVPLGQVAVLTERAEVRERVAELIKSLRGEKMRPWFDPHFYQCLPLVTANEHGLVVLLEHDLTVRWNGNPLDKAGVTFEQPTRDAGAVQIVRAYLGHGLLTIDNPWILRTPRGVNLFVGSPPNYFIDGIAWMSAVVESDHLRSDFTFNLRITRPNYDILIPAGTPIGYCLPFPKAAAAHNQVELMPEGETLERERLALRDFLKLRHGHLEGGIGRHYRKRVDVYGTPFREE